MIALSSRFDALRPQSLRRSGLFLGLAAGLLLAGNRDARSLQTWSEAGIAGEKPLYFFLERYAQAYRAEMAHFLACLAGKALPKVAANDGLRALELAEAANESLKSGQAVKL